MSPPTNNWRSKRTENVFYAEILTDITARNSILSLNWEFRTLFCIEYIENTFLKWACGVTSVPETASLPYYLMSLSFLVKFVLFNL